MTAFLSPCGGNGGSAALIISPEEALALIGEHLGAESDAAPPCSSSSSSSKVVVDLEEEPREPAKNNASRNPLRFSCTALSLAHKDHLDMDHSSRKQAEHYAVSLLSRPLIVGGNDDEKAISSVTERANELLGGFPCTGLPEVPAVLLRNIYESFAMLVDSRLRAYATFLARHCDTLARSKKKNLPYSSAVVGVRNVEQKLGTLLDVGSRIEASSMWTTFEVAETGTDDDEEDERDGDLKRKSYSLPLRLEAVINLVVPGPSGVADTLSVTQTTTGVISGKAFLACEKFSFTELHLNLFCLSPFFLIRMCRSVHSWIKQAKRSSRYVRHEGTLVEHDAPSSSRGCLGRGADKPCLWSCSRRTQAPAGRQLPRHASSNVAKPVNTSARAAAAAAAWN
jgi:hypothetical protein